MFVYTASGKEKKNYNVQSRPAVLELLAKYPHKDIHIFKDRNEADDFLRTAGYDYIER